MLKKKQAKQTPQDKDWGSMKMFKEAFRFT